MTVSTATPVKSQTGNGVTTVFAYDFRILKNTDLKVTVDGVTKTLTTDYTVSGVGDSGGGNVTFVSAPANGAAIVFEGNASFDRTTDYQRGGGFDEETVDKDFDRVVILIKQLKAILDRVPQLAAGQTLTQPALPNAVAQRFLRWKSDLTGLENIDIATLGALAVSDFMKTVLDDADADSAIQTYIAALTAEAAVAKDDTLILGDTSEAKGNKVTLENMLKVLTLLTAETAPAVGDELLLYDASATAIRKMTLANVIKVIGALTADTSPLLTDEYVFYDSVGGAPYKATLGDILKIVNSLTEDTTPDTAADFALVYDASAAAVKKVLLKKFGDVGNHEVRVTTGNGHGSTKNKFRRYTTTETNTGTAITYADSATDGASFTVNETGLYGIYMMDLRSDANCAFGISVNSSQGTTSIESITAANRKAYTRTAGAGLENAVSIVVRLAAGDVVNAHTDGGPNSASAQTSVFAIRKIAAL